MALMRLPLRTTLQNLRAEEIEVLRLTASLAALARDQERGVGRLTIALELDGDLHGLPPTAASHVCRIVQEGLTNIGKHADARRAQMALELRPALPDQAASPRRWLALTIENDGCDATGADTAVAGKRVGADRHARARDGARRTIGHRPPRRRLPAPGRDPVRGADGGRAMSGKAVRVLLVDDHAVVREGYRTLLEKQDGLTVVGEAANAATAYQCYKETRPDVVVMDISMPGRGGIDAIEHIRRLDAQARILVFTMHGGAPYALQAFRAGAKGYVTKSSPPEFLVSAVRKVAEGQVAICPETSEILALYQVQGERTELDGLSPREFEIFRMILAAKSTDEIAAALNVSRKTAAQLPLQRQVQARRRVRHRAPLSRSAAWAGRARGVGGERRRLSHRPSDREGVRSGHHSGRSRSGWRPPRGLPGSSRRSWWWAYPRNRARRAGRPCRGHSVGCHTDNAKVEHLVIVMCRPATHLVGCPLG